MRVLFLFVFILLSIYSNGQIISGKVIDSSTEEPLAFVSIGVKNMPLGTITDEQGNFEFKIKDCSGDSIVRVSMISFEPQIFTINDLIGKSNIIRLNTVAYEISEVIIRPSGKLRKVGNTDYNKKAGFCGWGRSDYGKGCEVGLKMKLGKKPVQLRSMHIRVHRQSYDSSLFRIHIRELDNNNPSKELLTENILFKSLKETGWTDIDLSSYNLVYNGDIMVSIEWVQVYGVIKEREMLINNNTYGEYVLISNQRNNGLTYTKWGSEDKWNILKNGSSPSIYFTIRTL
jgi:hypothetical protein